MDKIECPHCGKLYSKKGIGTHIWRSHGDGQNHDPNINIKNGLIKRTAWNKGLSKETDERIAKSCENISKSLKGKTNHSQSPETRERISSSMKQAHSDGRAWNIGKSRWNNEPSYPEKFFMQVIENEFEDKNYIREYSVSIYSIDFAWIDKKLAIEIDGCQHERFEDYKQRDIRKDEYLKSRGWKVLRIKWIDLFNNPKQYIGIAKDFINNTGL